MEEKKLHVKGKNSSMRRETRDPRQSPETTRTKRVASYYTLKRTGRKTVPMSHSENGRKYNWGQKRD